MYICVQLPKFFGAGKDENEVRQGQSPCPTHVPGSTHPPSPAGKRLLLKGAVSRRLTEDCILPKAKCMK